MGLPDFGPSTDLFSHHCEVHSHNAAATAEQNGKWSGIGAAAAALQARMALEDLFQPLTVRSLTTPNRFAMAPMTRQASPGGVPGPEVADYYRRRAAGGVGLIITEGVRLPDPAAGYPSSIPTLAGDDGLAGWRRVVDGVHREGGTIAAQLWHQGAERDDADGVVPVSPSGLDGLGRPKGRALETAELPELAELFARAAVTARDIGFDAVEVHGAHGYLLDEFLWARTNLREDGYGGPIGGRTRFPAQVVAAIRAAVGPDYPIIFRFSQWKGLDYQASIAEHPEQLQELLAPLVDAGVDVLHPSTRRHYAAAFPDHNERVDALADALATDDSPDPLPLLRELIVLGVRATSGSRIRAKRYRLFNEIEALRHRDVLGDLDYERVIVDHLMSRSVDEFHARVLAVSIMGIARSALTTWAHDPSCDPGNAAEAALEQLR